VRTFYESVPARLTASNAKQKRMDAGRRGTVWERERGTRGHERGHEEGCLAPCVCEFRGVMVLPQTCRKVCEGCAGCALMCVRAVLR